MKRIPLLMFLLLSAALLAGCSGDSTNQPTAGVTGPKDVVLGEIETGATAFEYTAAIDEGTLRVVGSILQYDAENHVLSVDFALVNETSVDLAGPVRLLFLQVMPDGVTILNADEPDTAVSTGALFEFALADEETVWLAGATTQVRTVQFGVEPGVSIGFTSRILLGGTAAGGTIAGLVWNDANADGVQDAGEMGVPGVEIMLYSGEKADDSLMMYADTDMDGAYAFAGLGSGHYTVSVVPADGIVFTTEPAIEVILVEYDGTVADFRQADFGVQVAAVDTLDCLAVGNTAHAKGWYDEELAGLDTELLEAHGADDACEEEEPEEKCGDTEDGTFWGRLVGPVTALDAETGAIAVMGTWVYPTATMKHDDRDGDYEIAVGDRVIVNAELFETEDGPIVMASGVRPFTGHFDRVRGTIQEVVAGEDGVITGVIVLNTFVSVPDGFSCYAEDDGEDDGHEDDHS